MCCTEKTVAHPYIGVYNVLEVKYMGTTTKSKHTAVRIPIKMMERIEALAFRRKMTISGIILEALEQYLAQVG